MKTRPSFDAEDFFVTISEHNDHALQMLARGDNPAGMLHRACQWHVSNGDAEWVGDDETLCVITEAGRASLALGGERLTFTNCTSYDLAAEPEGLISRWLDTVRDRLFGHRETTL